MRVETISSTAQKFNGITYYLCGQYYQRKGVRLHRVVWKYHNGDIPEGYHVHHKDGNRANNNIENLLLMLGRDHMREHMNRPERKAHSREIIKEAIKAAPVWHGSEDGKQWHSKHAKEYWKNAPMNTYVCDYCGKEYQSRNVSHTGSHFCSNNCRAYFRKKSGVDNEHRLCPVCGKEFTTNKYSKVKFCSRECGRKQRWGK